MHFAAYLEELLARRPRRPARELNLIVLERADSTNLLARRIVAEYEREESLAPPALILAFEQTGGIGRQGRSWASPPGKGVYATLGLQLRPAAALPTLPLLAGVGLCRALAPYLAAPCRLKWPNDVRVGGRKVGGVLAESRVRAAAESRLRLAEEGGGGEATAIVGFGVNLAHGREDLPVGVGTSLTLEGGGDVSLPELTWALVDGVLAELADFGDVAAAVARYRAASEHVEGDRLRCRTEAAEIEGTFRGFDEVGRLCLEVDGEERRLAAGEVLAP
ncbi:MAG TPA: biotin--[acetyl-CoA-carboxylase] ligase [Thermoanaerobaculia bacterium]|nr:biotin--[acetyl-CoA-carboxylase] ligase [Thermoanaerobaculia bacterium]